MDKDYIISEVLKYKGYTPSQLKFDGEKLTLSLTEITEETFMKHFNR
jgi:hypothetical protein